MALSLDQSLALTEEAIFRDMEGEGVVLDLASGRYFGVDRVGARIWQMLARGAALREIHGQLLQEFDVAPEMLERDLLEFADQLLRRGLATDS